jgi:hypothetical protein
MDKENAFRKGERMAIDASFKNSMQRNFPLSEN